MSNRKISECGLALIMEFEGFADKIYECQGGKLTIGYGHVMSRGEIAKFSAGISKVQAIELLRQDVANAEQSVTRLISADITPWQFDALVSFTFNVGAGALQRSSLRRRVNAGQHEQAAREFMRWIFAGGRKLEGLIRRRKAEADLYSKGYRQSH